MADLRGCACAAERLLVPDALQTYAAAACERAGLTVVASHWHGFAEHAAAGAQASGYTGVLLLAESHVAVHTWPEHSGATLDVYVCNYSSDNSAKAQALMDELVAWFSPAQALRHVVQRGEIEGGM